jgi:hypothetical protein
MITTGVTGGTWRATITPWGAIEPSDAAPGVAPLDWFVAADDRWHVPSREASVRQRRVDGTPVAETRLRVPGGDVVQTIYSCADAGGVTVVEVTNESTLPVAVAFSHRRVMTERPIADVPIEGIELPDGAFVMPLGHRASGRIGLPHTGGGNRPLPSLPTAVQTVRGWLLLTQRAGRLVLPEGEGGSSLAECAVAERCQLALGEVPGVHEQPAAFVVGVGELVRMGEPPDPWLVGLVEAVEAVAPLAGWEADVALDAAARVLGVAAERRATRDLERIMSRRSRTRSPAHPPPGVMSIAWLESRLVERGALFPHGIPGEWLGQVVEAYGLPAGTGGTTVSFALRWHGERPAVLWEQTGAPVVLTAPVVAPGWSSSAAKGEALWPAPAPVG